MTGAARERRAGAPRIGIIGARRKRQGLGPFVARGLSQAGADVTSFVCTSTETCAAAGADLARLAGVEARAYLSLDALLEHEDVDAVAILSPAERHREHIERALAAGVSVLCEKPLLWGRDDDLDAARRLLRDFAAAGLVLRENCQWPYTLPAFFALHPDARGEPLTRFAMRLSPASRGVDMIGDALPHALALLDALAFGADAQRDATSAADATSTRDAASAADAPSTRDATSSADDAFTVDDIHCSTHAADAEALAVRFTWRAGGRPVDVLVELDQGPSQPREAGFAVNGHWAHRLVRVRDYAQFFACGAALVDVPDPLPLLLSDFVAALSPDGAPHGPLADRRIVPRLSALLALRRAFLRDDP